MVLAPPRAIQQFEKAQLQLPIIIAVKRVKVPAMICLKVQKEKGCQVIRIGKSI